MSAFPISSRLCPQRQQLSPLLPICTFTSRQRTPPCRQLPPPHRQQTSSLPTLDGSPRNKRHAEPSCGSAKCRLNIVFSTPYCIYTVLCTFGVQGLFARNSLLHLPTVPDKTDLLTSGSQELRLRLAFSKPFPDVRPHPHVLSGKRSLQSLPFWLRHLTNSPPSFHKMCLSRSSELFCRKRRTRLKSRLAQTPFQHVSGIAFRENITFVTIPPRPMLDVPISAQKSST
jgi:hypothetical protein